MERALALRPNLATAWNDLGVSLVALGRDADAARAFERALRVQPRFVPSLANLGNLALRSGDRQGAEACYRRALQVDAAPGVARIGLGRALLQGGKVDEARAELQSALRRAPMSFDALLALCSLELGAGDSGQALHACEHFLRIAPQHSGAWGLWAELACERGDVRAEALLDIERWVQVQDVRLGSTSHEELSGVLLAQPSLSEAPPHHATRLGRHSGALSGMEHACLAVLESELEGAIGSFVAQRKALWPSAGAPTSGALHMWAVVLAGEGFQLPHLHPDASVSGVYYVSVPARSSSDPALHDGDLEFGRPDPELPFVRPRRSHYVRPKPGRLVLFPSWLYHSTVPHRSTGLRISVAFDCVRVGG